MPPANDGAVAAAAASTASAESTDDRFIESSRTTFSTSAGSLTADLRELTVLGDADESRAALYLSSRAVDADSPTSTRWPLQILDTEYSASVQAASHPISTKAYVPCSQSFCGP